jgi:hypothetical protein
VDGVRDEQSRLLLVSVVREDPNQCDPNMICCHLYTYIYMNSAWAPASDTTHVTHFHKDSILSGTFVHKHFTL